MATVDPGAIRNTPDVEILIRRSDFVAVQLALESDGFKHHPMADFECFVDGAEGRLRDAVILRFAGEIVRSELDPSPNVMDSVPFPEYQVLSLEPLVRMLLNSFRRVDRMHLRDLLDIGLIDSSWLPRLLPEHAARLQELIDDPNG